MLFLESRKPCFFVERNPMVYLGLLKEKQTLRKLQILDQNHGLTPLEKGQVFDFALM